jgi:toxin-antitoxin system PIN domain toxin
VIIPDVNLLLYASITAFPQHSRARAWWEQTINSDKHVGLAQPALFGFLRIATNARLLQTPLTVDAAVGYVQDWLAQPNVHLLTPGPDHLHITLGLLRDIGTAGNLTTDAQLAAYAIEHKGEMYSNDTDFARFPDLKWINPLK